MPPSSDTWAVRSFPGPNTGETVHVDSSGRHWLEVPYLPELGTGDRVARLYPDGRIVE